MLFAGVGVRREGRIVVFRGAGMVGAGDDVVVVEIMGFLRLEKYWEQ